MSKTLRQSVTFKASPERLYQIYLSSKEHGAAIGDKASIQPKAGGRFSAFGMLTGKILFLVKNRMIVQTWRAKPWKKKDPDSILILTFRKVKGGTRIDLIHEGIPEYDYRDIQKGWPNYYWKPWKKYLSRRK